MDPFAQAHLSELLSAARMGSPAPSADVAEHKARTLMTFNAALAALKGVGAVSDEEMADWTNRMLVVLGERPLPTASARHGEAGHLWVEGRPASAAPTGSSAWVQVPCLGTGGPARSTLGVRRSGPDSRR